MFHPTNKFNPLGHQILHVLLMVVVGLSLSFSNDCSPTSRERIRILNRLETEEEFKKGEQITVLLQNGKQMSGTFIAQDSSFFYLKIIDKTSGEWMQRSVPIDSIKVVRQSADKLTINPIAKVSIAVIFLIVFLTLFALEQMGPLPLS